jgi:UDPglucose 6-dehydrogenase
MSSISIIGIGFVGNAILESFILKGYKLNQNLFIYDKYKNGGIGDLSQCLNTEILFLALPTPYNNEKKEYDKSAILDICLYLYTNNYTGSILIKSTVEPETTNNLSKIYPSLNFIHNPEFLSAKTAFEDFHNQKHIVLGRGINCRDECFNNLLNFYKLNYPDAEISVCNSNESESMKIFCNSFYAVKIQFFTELYLLCQKNNSDFETIRNLMLKNNWINPMHTKVPGTDGNISYGGLCFPKDTLALNNYMIKKESHNMVLNSTIDERNQLRNDNPNIIN